MKRHPRKLEFSHLPPSNGLIMFTVLLLCSTLVAAASVALAFHRQRRFEQLLKFTQRLLRRDKYGSFHSNLGASRDYHPGSAQAIGHSPNRASAHHHRLRRRRGRSSRARTRQRHATASNRGVKGIHHRRRRSPKRLGGGSEVL